MIVDMPIGPDVEEILLTLTDEEIEDWCDRLVAATAPLMAARDIPFEPLEISANMAFQLRRYRDEHRPRMHCVPN